MKISTHLLYAFMVLLPLTDAHPGMTSQITTMRRLAAKQSRQASKELIGDLKTLPDSKLTPIAKDIKAIILDQKSAESNTIDSSIPAGNIGSAACKADACCHWKWLAYEMTAKFNGTSGRCTKFARQAVRLGFHDAGVWTKTSGYGGADGSILLSNEMSRTDNDGLQAIADQTKKWYNKYNQHGMSMADIIQFGANVATVVCPLGPRVRSFVGRKDNSNAGPTGLLPGEKDSADTLLKLFAAKTIDAHDLVALVGAHTTSQQHFVDTTRDGDPQDTTPGVWDIAFYPQTTANPPVRVLKFQSDINLSKDSRTKGEWAEFSDRNLGQSHWNEDYAKAYTRLSLLGVNNINELKECTKVMPAARTTFVSEDQVLLDRWLNGEFDQLNNLVDDAIQLTGVVSGT
ncbi:similar to ligninase H2 precursor [Plenodomus lingam JN3]|uniref:Peroxidase n=1 Tax=Leptosphaeria maculans (strain JN3 / isolate v23.1.3 / race Av1-4-5-6-7-8) TaxID=985895 RepID=E4ZH58_LEPMJ|nr:similar to ligninase H2 precursor [Plenodomus lingam JN3]CBX90628.1 similar to ligninase H2 precursor [Plenodomus lingam JN3]